MAGIDARVTRQIRASVFVGPTGLGTGRRDEQKRDYLRSLRQPTASPANGPAEAWWTNVDGGWMSRVSATCPVGDAGEVYAL